MSAYANQVKSYIERYQEEVGGDGLLDPHAVAEWAYQNGLHKPSVRAVVDAIASDIAQQFRDDYRTDANGQRYRAIHAVRSKQGDKTMSLWADMDDDRAPREHFVRSFAQRRLANEFQRRLLDATMQSVKEASNPLRLTTSRHHSKSCSGTSWSSLRLTMK